MIERATTHLNTMSKIGEAIRDYYENNQPSDVALRKIIDIYINKENNNG